MLNESLNSDSLWRKKLEGLESNAGEPFNKEAAWNSLHGRLQKKSGYKKFVWLYAAAACLLVALTLGWFWPGEKENVMVKNDVEKSPVKKINGLQAAFDSKDSISFISLTPVEKTSHVPIESRHKINNPADRKTFTIENVALKNEKEEFKTPEIINNEITRADTQINLVAIVLERKKLPIVHINELGDPVEESPVVLHKTGTHSFQWKFANEEVFVNPSIRPVKSGFTISSSKNSPN